MRTIICFIIGTVFCIKSTAQSNYYIEERKVFAGGLILGANISKVEDIDDFSNYHQIGFNTGGIVHINFTEHFGVAMEMLFSQKGSHEINQANSFSSGTYISEYVLRLNYVEVPFTLHYTQDKMDYEFGMSYSRLVTFDEWAYEDPPITFDPEKNSFKKSDWEFIFGCTYHLYKHYYFNVRWQYSFVAIRDTEQLPTNRWYDGQQNNVFNFRLIYMF